MKKRNRKGVFIEISEPEEAGVCKSEILATFSFHGDFYGIILKDENIVRTIPIKIREGKACHDTERNLESIGQELDIISQAILELIKSETKSCPHFEYSGSCLGDGQGQLYPSERCLYNEYELSDQYSCDIGRKARRITTLLTILLAMILLDHHYAWTEILQYDICLVDTRLILAKDVWKFIAFVYTAFLIMIPAGIHFSQKGKEELLPGIRKNYCLVALIILFFIASLVLDAVKDQMVYQNRKYWYETATATEYPEIVEVKKGESYSYMIFLPEKKHWYHKLLNTRADISELEQWENLEVLEQNHELAASFEIKLLWLLYINAERVFLAASVFTILYSVLFVRSVTDVQVNDPYIVETMDLEETMDSEEIDN